MLVGFGPWLVTVKRVYTAGKWDSEYPSIWFSIIFNSQKLYISLYAVTISNPKHVPSMLYYLTYSVCELSLMQNGFVVNDVFGCELSLMQVSSSDKWLMNSPSLVVFSDPSSSLVRLYSSVYRYCNSNVYIYTFR